VGRSIRLAYRGTLAPEHMGEFSLAPQQGPVRAVFVSLARIQRDLDQAGRLNTLLVAGSEDAEVGTVAVRTALSAAIDLNDIGLDIVTLGRTGTVLVESRAGLISDPLATALDDIGTDPAVDATPVLTWLATRLSGEERSVPYSLVAALGPSAGGDERLAQLLAEDPAGLPPMVLNDWAAGELDLSPGDPIEVEYYRWEDSGRLATETATFRYAGAIPIDALAADRSLAPDYPGITDTNSLADWDPPFPIDFGRVRPVDEDYWQRYRTTPKAFIALAAGQDLWRSRYGQVTSIRFDAGSPDVGPLATRVRERAHAIGPLRAGFNIVDIRSQNLTASVGATDFGAYFSYFSFFLMVSALMLAGLFFRLSVEQRHAEVGVLRAAGFSERVIRRVFLMEGGLVSIVGALLGVLLAVGWAALMMYGLRTWWTGAVGTTRLVLFVDPLPLAIGAGGGLAAAAFSIALTVRHLGRATPRELITGSSNAVASSTSRGGWLAAGSLGLAVVLSALSVMGLMPAVGGFFGAGGLVLIGGLAAFRMWLGRHEPGSFATSPSLVRLGMRNASWRPGRSLTAAGLVAAAVFLLVAVDSFRKGDDGTRGPQSGTGGFALMAESALPMVNDPATLEGREALGLSFSANDPNLDGVTLAAARLREGDDASCLNLYRPQRPRVLGLPDALIEAGRFRFGTTLASTDAEIENPWRLLGPVDADGIVPVIVDQTSLQYVLHAAVGDVIVIDEDTTRPIRLRVVAALADTVLQGEIVVAESAFLSLFPDEAGYRVVFVDIADPARTDDVARFLEARLEPYGLDAQETALRLEAFHRVENTYLSTFQSLGGLGLVLGSLGLAAIIARNVLERRRELALLGAAGFSGRHLQRLVVAENLTVVVAGIGIGLAAALVAIGPVLYARGSAPPALPLVWVVLVAVVGLLSSLGATRSIRRLPLVPSLRSE